MRKIHIISLISILILFTLESIAVDSNINEQNLVKNPSFEEGDGIWPHEWKHSVGDNGITSLWLGKAHDGDYSIALLQGSVEWETESFIPIETEVMYHCSFWYYLSESFADGEDFRKFVVYFDENGKELYSSVRFVSNPIIGSWQEIYHGIKITDKSVTKIKIRFSRNSISEKTNPEAFLKIDDIKFIRLDEDIS